MSEDQQMEAYMIFGHDFSTSSTGGSFFLLSGLIQIQTPRSQTLYTFRGLITSSIWSRENKAVIAVIVVCSYVPFWPSGRGYKQHWCSAGLLWESGLCDTADTAHKKANNSTLFGTNFTFNVLCHVLYVTIRLFMIKSSYNCIIYTFTFHLVFFPIRSQ